MRIEHWDVERDGQVSESGLEQRLRRWGYRGTLYTYPPGTRFSVHAHDVDKVDAVVSGRFRLTLGEESTVLAAGDCAFVPAREVHSAEVIGDEPVVSLDAVRDAAIRT